MMTNGLISMQEEAAPLPCAVGPHLYVDHRHELFRLHVGHCLLRELPPEYVPLLFFTAL